MPRGRALYFSRAPIPCWRDGRAAARRPARRRRRCATSACTPTAPASCAASRRCAPAPLEAHRGARAAARAVARRTHRGARERAAARARRRHAGGPGSACARSSLGTLGASACARGRVLFSIASNAGERALREAPRRRTRHSNDRGHPMRLILSGRARRRQGHAGRPSSARSSASRRSPPATCCAPRSRPARRWAWRPRR